MSESLLEFPCDFPLKVTGMQSPEFVPAVVELVHRHAPDFAAESVELRASSGGKYLAVTCTIRAVSREQLDNLYRELTAHAQVKVVL